MTEEPQKADITFENLCRQGDRAVQAGRLEEAEILFEEALAWARGRGASGKVDLGICNRAAVLIERGRGAAELPLLREILLRNADPVACRMAAYNIARHYEINKNFKKALFYARITRDRSEVLCRNEWIASSHNLIGNTLLAESFIGEAAAEYEKALELMPVEPSVRRAQILDNLGYCRILQGNPREGYSLLYESLRWLRRLGARRHMISARLDLCFAHLETGRYRQARLHGDAALALAEHYGEPESIKNALYLLGEAANLTGDPDTAMLHFRRLQRSFFPDDRYIPEFLVAVDIRKLVNLHA